MAILVTCDKCGTKLRVRDEYLGKEAWCPDCKAPLTLQGERVPNHEVFVSYSNKDKAVADAICATLEEKKIRCWIAPRDISAGHSWGGSIIDAIEDAKVMILVYSCNSNLSPQVIREVERAVAKGLALVPFRIEAAPMSKEMEYFLSASHWLDALTPPLERHLGQLAEMTRLLLFKKGKDAEARPVLPHLTALRPKEFPWRNVALVLTGAMLALGMVFWVQQHKQNEGFAPRSTVSAPPAPQVVSAAPAVSTTATTSITSVIPAVPAVTQGARNFPALDAPFENSLEMQFVPVPGTKTLFCKWLTRVQDFEAFVKATGYDATKDMSSLRSGGWEQHGDSWKNPGFEQGPTYPVAGVSWEDAKAFCKWLTEKERTEGRLAAGQEYRLPTDAEWSVAVGLGPETGNTPAEKDSKIKDVYPWGPQWPPPPGTGNFAGEESKTAGSSSDWNVIAGYNDGHSRTSPVGSFKANRYGLCDMAGNLWQWCEDWYDSDQKFRVSRGGSWLSNDPDTLLSSYRGGALPGNRHGLAGFRVVLVSAGSARRPDATMAATQPPPTLPVAPIALPTLTPPAIPMGQRWINSLGMIFVPVPGTKVLFSIWDSRVQDYQPFVQAIGRSWQTPPFGQGPTHPAVNVNWEDATAFCQWLTQHERQRGRLGHNQFYRLPKDWEWSVAVGLDEPRENFSQNKDGKIRNVYPWEQGHGTWPPPREAGNYDPALNVDSFPKTSPVGTFAANAHGLFDMGGNVWQWCEDCYDEQSGNRILRGGSWLYGNPGQLLSSYRRSSRPELRNDISGFRCVLADEVAPSP